MLDDDDARLLDLPMPPVLPKGAAPGFRAPKGQLSFDEWKALAQKKLTLLAKDVGAIQGDQPSWYVLALILALRHEAAFQFAPAAPDRGGKPATRSTPEGRAAGRELMELVDTKISAAAATGTRLKPSVIYSAMIRNPETMPAFFRQAGRGNLPASAKTLRDYVDSARKEKAREDELVKLMAEPRVRD